MACGRRPAFLLRAAAPRGGRHARDSGGDGEVAAPSIARDPSRFGRDEPRRGTVRASGGADRMTTFDRFQDDLPVTLIELADERMPDYVDDLLGRTAASSQRPAWSFPGRWIPMADLIAERTFVPRVPWRALAVAALLALLIGGAI